MNANELKNKVDELMESMKLIEELVNCLKVNAISLDENKEYFVNVLKCMREAKGFMTEESEDIKEKIDRLIFELESVVER